MSALLKSARWGLRFLRRSLLFYGVRVYAVIAGQDARETAVRFGRISSMVYLSAEILGEIFRIREPDISIVPDFLGERTRCDMAFRLLISPAAVLVAAASVLFSYLGTKNKNAKYKKREGYQHESTASGQ